MDAVKSGEQLIDKISSLSGDLDSFSESILLSVFEAIQKILPNFRLPEDLELINCKDVLLKPKRRGTRFSKAKKASIARTTRGRKRTFADSSPEDASACFRGSRAPKSEMTLESVPEDSDEHERVEATPKTKRLRQGSANRKQKNQGTITKASKKNHIEIAASTPASYTAAVQPTPKLNATYNRIIQIPAPSDPPKFIAAVPPSPEPMVVDYDSPKAVFKAPAATAVLKRPPKSPESMTQHNRSLRLKSPATSAPQPPPIIVSDAVFAVSSSTPSPKRSPTLKSPNVTATAIVSNSAVVAQGIPERYSSIMSEESGAEGDHCPDVAVVTSTTAAPVLPVSAAPPPRAAPAKALPPVISTPGLLGANMATPWSGSAGPSWLSRLGWFNSSNQQAAGGGGKQITPQVTHSAVVSGPGARTLPRLPPGIGGGPKMNCSVISEKSFTTGASRTSHNTTTSRISSSKTTTSAKPAVAAEERRLRVIAELASKTERSRRLEQQREEERRARARAKDAHRAAVRANAERVAQEKQAALARKMEVERLRLLKPREKQQQQPPPRTSSKTNTSVVLASGARPLSVISTNVHLSGAPGSVHSGAAAFRNFDYVNKTAATGFGGAAIPTQQHVKAKTPMATVPAAAAAAPLATVEAKKESLTSYDLAGILSDYNSDSEEENRRKKMPYPSWAKPGSADLLKWVTSIYKGEVQWQRIFRPAEQVHIADVELFHGYKFRVRPRGSSAVWLDPHQQPT